MRRLLFALLFVSPPCVRTPLPACKPLPELSVRHLLPKPAAPVAAPPVPIPARAAPTAPATTGTADPGTAPTIPVPSQQQRAQQALFKTYPDGGRSDPAGFQVGLLACAQAQQAPAK